jgi:hypothetical protein
MAVIRTTGFQDTAPTWPDERVGSLAELVSRLG